MGFSNEYQKLTITGDRWKWIKENNLNHHQIFQEAVDRLQCKLLISLPKEQIEWLELNGIDINFFVRKAINKEIYDNHD